MNIIRFIPVLTGNTANWSALPDAMAVYPRTHGEHKVQALSSNPKNGLSPYSRGTLSAIKWMRCGWRFIPVLTGNTFKHGQKTNLISVYPRTHGEHKSSDNDGLPNIGLSPYSRGTRIRLH